MLKFIPVFVLALACSPLFADVIVFKNGEELEATILERDEVQLKVEVNYGTMLVPLERIRRIEADTPEKVEARAKKRAEEKETAERMKAEGKVLYKGKWVDEADKKKDEAKIAAERQKKKEAELAAKKKAEEAAAALAKKKEEERLAQQAQQDLNNSRAARFNNRHDRNNDQFGDQSSRNDRYNYNNNQITSGGNYGGNSYGGNSYGGSSSSRYGR